MNWLYSLNLTISPFQPSHKNQIKLQIKKKYEEESNFTKILIPIKPNILQHSNFES